jgi:hypothetical protein
MGAIAVLAGLLVPASAWAQHAPLPATLVALDSPEGQRLFAEADARADFFPLSEQLVSQRRANFCGVASAVTVLNALQVAAPEDGDVGAPYFTQDNFWNERARGVLSPTMMPGITLDQLADLLQCHPATAHATHAADTTLEAFRAVAAKNLATPGDFLIVNYDRAGVGQETMGHISPLGAYNSKADKILLLDVARYKYPPVWADTAALFAAMKTKDFVSDRTRGFVVVAAAPTPPGPTGARPARNLLHIGIGILALSFALGALAGAFVQTRRLKGRSSQERSATP